MKIKFLLLALLILSNIINPTVCNAQGFSWAQGFNAVGGAVGIGVTTFDATNHIYSLGNFSGTIDLDQSANVYNLTASVPGALFVLKEDAAGNFKLGKAFVRKSNTVTSVAGVGGRGIALDANNNIYIGGYFTDTVDFDPGPGTYYMTPPLGSTANINTFIVKLNPNGDFVWAKQIGGAAGNSGALRDMKLTPSGIYLNIAAGPYTVDVDPGPNTLNMSGGILEKLDTAGNLIWARQGYVVGGNFVMDSSSNLYFTGGVNGTVDFDPGPGVANLSTPSTFATAMAIAKYDSAGNYIWAKQIGMGSNDEVAQDIAVDRWGNVAVTGYFNYTLDFDPGPAVHNLVATSRDAFTLSLTTNGDYRWAKSISLPSNNGGQTIATDTLGNVYMAGVGGPPLTKYDSSGNVVWQASVPGTPAWVGIDPANNVYSTGNFSGTQDFDPGPGVYNLSAPGFNGGGFIQKLCQSFSTTTLTASDTIGCVGDTIYLSTPLIPGATRYEWERNNTFFTDTNTIAVTQSGNYRVTVFGGSCPLYSNYIHIVIALNPHPLISLSAPSSAPLGQPVTVTATLTYPGTNYTIDWYNNGALFSTTTTPSVTFTKQQPTALISAILRPTVICYDTAVYSDTVTILTDTVTSVSTVAYSLPIQVYPNPFGNEVVINGLAAGDAILLLDAIGRVLLKTEAINDTKVVDTKELALGYYVIKVLSKEGRMKGNVPVVKR